MTEGQLVRELAWIRHELEPPADDASLMTEEEFGAEVATAGAGGWEQVGLDALPADWAPASIEDLRNAA